MDSELTQKLKELVLDLVKEAGCELFELNLNRHKKNIFIRILVDRPQGGITIEQCAQLNRQIHQRIDDQGWLPGPYSLELSSPGADRPLLTKKDFLRVINHEVHFFLRPLDHLQQEYNGILKEVHDDEVIIDSVGREVHIPLDMIKNAKQNI